VEKFYFILDIYIYKLLKNHPIEGIDRETFLYKINNIREYTVYRKTKNTA
jgi:hypothetical protein